MVYNWQLLVIHCENTAIYIYVKYTMQFKLFFSWPHISLGNSSATQIIKTFISFPNPWFPEQKHQEDFWYLSGTAMQI